MKDPAFANAYEEIQPEMNVIRAIIEAGTSQNLTQTPGRKKRNHTFRDQLSGKQHTQSKHHNLDYVK